jgi:GNAT superfamily N-acetyltransferase
VTPLSRGTRLAIEPLDPSRHDRAGFASGVAAVDNYLLRTANKLMRAGNVRVFVMVDDDETLIGFYALNAHAVQYGELSAAFARDRPGHGAIPAAFISMIGVDVRYQGRGFGGDLLVDALRRVALAGHEIGIRVVMLDVLDCGEPALVERRRRLYESYGFVALPTQPLRLFLPTAAIDTLLAPPS